MVVGCKPSIIKLHLLSNLNQRSRLHTYNIQIMRQDIPDIFRSKLKRIQPKLCNFPGFSPLCVVGILQPGIIRIYNITYNIQNMIDDRIVVIIAGAFANKSHIGK